WIYLRRARPHFVWPSRFVSVVDLPHVRQTSRATHDGQAARLVGNGIGARTARPARHRRSPAGQGPIGADSRQTCAQAPAVLRTDGSPFGPTPASGGLANVAARAGKVRSDRVLLQRRAATFAKSG